MPGLRGGFPKTREGQDDAEDEEGAEGEGIDPRIAVTTFP